MKLLFSSLAFLGFNFIAQSQILIDPFDYTGNNLTNAPGTLWTLHSGTTPVEILSTSSDSGSSLSFSNLALSSGNRVKLNFANSADAGVTFANQVTNEGSSLYASFLVKVTGTPFTNYFAHFFQSNSGTVFRGTSWIRSSGNDIQLGVALPTSNAVFSAQTLSTNVTHFVVLKYSRNPGPDNDLVSLFINPVPGQPEPIPSATQTEVGRDVNASGIGRFALRQSAGIGAIELDELRIGTNWNDVTPIAQLSTNIVTISNTSDSSELGTNGIFTLTSTGSNFPITVTYLLTGSATFSNDFTLASPTTTNSVVMTNSTQVITVIPIQDNDNNEVDPETVILTLDSSGLGWISGNPSSATNSLYQGNIPLPSSTPGYLLELRKPKPGTQVQFLGTKGFKTKGRVKSTNTVSSVSYTVLISSNTNLIFVPAGKFKALTKGLLFKKGYRATYRSTKTSRVGVGIEPGTTSLKLITKIEGSAGEAYFTNTFSTQVK